MLLVYHSNLITNTHSEMQRIAKFLNLYPTSSKFDCVARSPITVRFKRTPVKLPFNPLAFVSNHILSKVRQSEKLIMDMINQRIHQEEERHNIPHGRATSLS